MNKQIAGIIGTVVGIGLIIFAALLLKSNTGPRSGHSPITACIHNLRQIDGAKQQWALETKAEPTATPTWENIRPYLGRGTSDPIPKCPEGGSYTISSLQSAPRCSIPAHTIN